MPVRAIPEEASIWIRRLNKHLPHHRRQASPTHYEPKRTKWLRKGEFVLCLSSDCHLLLPLGIYAPGLWSFRLGLPLMPAVSPVLQLLDLDWDLYHQLPWFSSLQTKTELYMYTCILSASCSYRLIYSKEQLYRNFPYFLL